jgi:energy-coupling factor transporter ATP-binding protein EcfA2
MKLARLRVAELRKFQAPFELPALQPGLNIFTGPNEAGKSTLVRAIRAAFFERHRSTSVDDLRPHGDSAAAPVIELDFEIGGMPYRLIKSFLQKKRCELMVGTQRYEGVEAEDFLARQLGFEFALKGASQERHWGIPGLLWIEQGSAQAVQGSVEHAADHLRSALDESLGEVATSGGDEVLQQVRKQRDELLTGTGKPRAAYQLAIDEARSLDQQVAALTQAVAAYREQVDQLRLLHQAHAADASEQPWLALRERQAQAQAALQAVEALATERDAEREKLRRITGLRELLLQQLGAAEQQQEQLASREAALTAAGSRHEQATTLEGQALLADSAAAARLQAARAALALARQEHNRASLNRQRADAQTRAAELAALLAHAGAQHERGVLLRREAALLRIEPGELQTLRTQQQRLDELAIRQAAAATRLRFELDAGVSVQLAGEPLVGSGERLLVAPGSLALPGIGQIHIAPGGSDLAELAREADALRDRHQALLQRLGLATLADAEARDQAHRQKLADASAAEKAQALLAPKGLDALRSDLDAAQARHAEAAAALAELPAPAFAAATAAAPDAADAPAAPDASVPPLASAEREHDALRLAADAANQQLQQARQQLASAASQRDSAQRERDLLKAAIEDPQRQAELVDRRHQLLDASAQEAAARAAIDRAEQRIAAARPEILRQDVERLRRSADEAERGHHARDRQIVALETTLAAAGVQGLEEELASRQSELGHAERRRDELRRRAEALDFLLQRLDQRRQALMRRLQAPLQKHLDRYLQLLFPSGRLEVDENLLPGALTRTGPRGPEAGDFDSLSFGAREQMGVISRLAYADLLKAAGRPTLLILDDALVHSDEQRLAQMKRVLFDAAQRHQVLLFTCHPAHWRDMGVPLRALESPR